MSSKKINSLMLVGVTLFLQSCGKHTDELFIAPENVEIVAQVGYYSDGDFDWKNAGEKILIASGEILQVHRNQIRPDAKLITRFWSEEFFLKFEKPSPATTIPLRLDRKKGIVCNAAKCARLYSICPRWTEMGQGKQCVSFAQD